MTTSALTVKGREFYAVVPQRFQLGKPVILDAIPAEAAQSALTRRLVASHVVGVAAGVGEVSVVAYHASSTPDEGHPFTIGDAFIISAALVLGTVLGVMMVKRAERATFSANLKMGRRPLQLGF